MMIVLKRFFMFLLLDFLLLVVALWLALHLQWDVIPMDYNGNTALFAFVTVASILAGFYLCGVYRRMWQYAGIPDFLNLILAVTWGTVLLFALTLILLPFYYLRFIPHLWLIALLLLGSVRFARRLRWRRKCGAGRSRKGKNTLIIGAGEAGALIVRTLQSTKGRICLNPVGFVDDDPGKRGLRLCGLPVLGTRHDIPDVVRRLNVDEAIIAIPTATPEQIKAIADISRQAGIRVKVLPNVLDIIQGKNLLDQVRELQMEDLLHRSEVDVNLDQVSGYLKGNVVLVTGAGGSIGAELCRQICAYTPRELILLGRGENSIYEINLELAKAWPEVTCIPVIADIRDQERLSDVFSRYQPAVVFHAAAHKHITLMELHPEEAFKNNVFGTLNVAKAADCYKAKIFVLISTDKAVNPSSILGVTKLLAEMVTHHFAGSSETKFVSVRFGNVLGSRGSVVQLFRKQIAAGGPVTVTHPDMRRYFMTVREAVQLVIQAGAMAGGGELFMLDMGEQVRIEDLARDMIRLSGLCPGEDIEIKYLGIRPGEKLFEELLTEREKAVATRHQKIFMVENGAVDNELVNQILSVESYPGKEMLAGLMDSVFSRFNLTRNKPEECSHGGNQDA